MKTYGVLLAGLLLAASATADEANSETSDSLTLAAAKTTEAINFKTEQKLNSASIKVLDLDVAEKSDQLAEKISAKLDKKFEEDMQRRLKL
ncbi:hypothetical protein [Gilvimarinus algae]|uniref:Uncharacterized protein n=1 Tax=Gilvimarinus algae TaxID=3058037 RepID=A0ABT8TF94_9GAMM|nr:hypothetical protein [Gilvimarinus sp. SDUM040014]MDO3381763.1 hypothetical protein [Gilvimarinus sp. SDUM040014]